MSSTAKPNRTAIVSRIARFVTLTHVFFYRLTGGALGGSKNLSTLLLTTTGRKSGKQHTTPLFSTIDGDRYVVIASNGGAGTLPNWWLNMRKGGPAQVEIGRERMQVSAQVAEGEERARLWSRMVAGYPGYDKYQEATSYPIPVVILSPVASNVS
ncbi:MAG: nitroreductase family deazaflavin-dependent oxidoreductase [Ktedonobacteraceae bacterium]|nr:nitroreductase family deazaflavin-dependent oxidoreductase [Ktedonobacteraceae bacterium]